MLKIMIELKTKKKSAFQLLKRKNIGVVNTRGVISTWRDLRGTRKG